MDEEEENPLYNPEVIEALENLIDDETDARRRWLVLDMVDVSERDAIYAVGFLHATLVQERTTGNNSSDISSSQPRRTTGLLLGGHWMSDQAIEIFCDFLRRTEELPALSLKHLLSHQYHRLLTALETNTSVKAFHFRLLVRMTSDDPEFGERIASLLRSRNDFQVLDFYDTGSELLTSHVLPFIRHGLPHLRKLRFSDCAIQNGDVASIVQALVDGSHHDRLEELDLSLNLILPHGLGALCGLSSFTRLKRLNLRSNFDLLWELDIVQRFIEVFLLSSVMTLEEFSVAYCLRKPDIFALFIKALETNYTLRRFSLMDRDINAPRIRAPIRDQLVASLPKMKGIRELTCAWEEFDEHEMALIVTAIRQNTSLLKLWTEDINRHMIPFATPVITAIFKRNKYLSLLDGFLGTAATSSLTATTGTDVTNANATDSTTTCTATASIPDGLWARVLKTVGKCGGDEGASPVFKILRARLASWPRHESSNSSSSNNKRKRQETIPGSQEEQD